MREQSFIPGDRWHRVLCYNCHRLHTRDGAGALFAPCGHCGSKDIHVVVAAKKEGEK